MNLRAKFRAFFRKEKLDAEMSEELRAHLELQTAENQKRGMSTDDARHAAQRSFGGVEQIKERVRDQRALVWLEQGWRDFCFARRQLAKSPGFSAIAVISLALGIGANTAIFSLVDEVLLKSLPVKNPEELVLLSWRAVPIPMAARQEVGFTNGLRGGWTDPEGNDVSYAFSMLTFDRFHDHSQTLADIFGFFAESELNVIIDGQAEISNTGQFVTGNYHAALGVSAILGRTFTADDDRENATPVAVLSYGFWQRRFGGVPSVVGKTIIVNKTPVTVIGVTPPEFHGTLEVGAAPDLSLPLVQLLAQFPGRGLLERQRNDWWLRIMGRLKPNVTREQAQGELAGLFRESVQEGIASMKRSYRGTLEERYFPQLRIESGAQGLNRMRPFYVRSLATLMGLAGLVLLLACANVANLLLARGAARRREIAVRLALGAGRGRLVRQLLAESVGLAILGGAAGVVFASWGKDLLIAMQPLGWGGATDLELKIDARVLGFSCVIAVGACVLAGLMPALRATRLDLTAEFQGGSRTTGSPSTLRLRRGLMIMQVALSVMLLVAAGLFGRTLQELRRTDLGFTRDRLLLFRIDATTAGYQPPQFPELRRRLTESMAALPGVRSVALSAYAPFDGANRRVFWLPGQPLPKSHDWVSVNAIGPNYLETMGVPVVLGRTFGLQDDERGSKVAVINQALARKYFGEENPVGRRFSIDPFRPEPKIEIVGVVRDTKWTDVKDAVPPTMYFPFTNDHVLSLSEKWAQMNFVVRCTDDSSVALASLRAAVREIDGTLPVTDLHTLGEQIDRLFTRERLFARLSSFFGLVALALASVGLYGLMSYVVLSRTGEIGLRMALGALPADVLRMILRESIKLVALGVVVGISSAALASRLIATMLYHLSPIDPLTYGAVALVLVVVALLACWLPARRAAKVDPMVALRAE